MNRNINQEDSFKILYQARRFSVAANIINSSPKSDPSLIIPWAVNSAVSLELYLKSILNFETGSFPENHKLDNIYSRLSSKSRDEIDIEFQEQINKRGRVHLDEIETAAGIIVSSDIIKNLKDCSRLIVEVRYIFDIKPGNAISFVYLNELIASVSKRADSLIKNN